MSEDSAPYDTGENEHPINLKEHLEKLVGEWQALRKDDHTRDSLRQVLGLLEGQAQLYARENSDSALVAELILQDLDNLGELENMRVSLETYEEARELDLWSLLSEYHPSSLD